MQQYSYFLLPLIPFTNNITPPPQAQTLFATLSPPSHPRHPTHSSPSLTYQTFGNSQLALQQTPFNQENKHTPQSSRRYMNSGASSLPGRSESLIADINAFKYAKKNAQSNLINQIFSYISIASKSGPAVLKLFGGRERKSQFYFQVMRQLKRQNKKYINRTYLKDLLLMQNSHIIHGILQKNKLEDAISQTQLRKILRILVFTFLREKCVLTILTSIKLDRYSIREHLQRRREVLEYLCYHLRVAVEIN